MVLDLTSTLVSYTPLDWSFISIKFFVLSLDSWFDVLSSKFIIFYIPLLFYYTNFNIWIICSIFPGDVLLFHVFFGIAISSSFC